MQMRDLEPQMYYHLSQRRLSPVSYGGYPQPAGISLLGINSAAGMILLTRKEARLFYSPHTAPGKTYSVLLSYKGCARFRCGSVRRHSISN